MRHVRRVCVVGDGRARIRDDVVAVGAREAIAAGPGPGSDSSECSRCVVKSPVVVDERLET